MQPIDELEYEEVLIKLELWNKPMMLIGALIFILFVALCQCLELFIVFLKVLGKRDLLICEENMLM